MRVLSSFVIDSLAEMGYTAMSLKGRDAGCEHGLFNRKRETTRFRAAKTRKSTVDKLSTVLSNWGLAFVFNKPAMGGGALAERRRQKAAVIW
jgi:hypothetical protein